MLTWLVNENPSPRIILHKYTVGRERDRGGGREGGMGRGKRERGDERGVRETQGR